MIQQIIFRSLLGWNRYLTAQRLVASMIIGGICGGTKTAIGLITGTDKRKREQEELQKLREEKLIRESIEMLKVELDKEATEKVNEMVKQTISED